MSALRSHDLISTHEASSTLGCTIQHMRLLIRTGKVRGEKIGRDWLADRVSVLAFREARAQAKLTTSELQVREQRSLFEGSEYQPVVNVASVPQRSPFRYPGGKTWLIPVARLWLGSISPRRASLIEPFAGGGGIGLTAAFEGYVEKSTLVELDPDVACVWRVMLGRQSGALCARIRGFTCTEHEVRSVLTQTPKSDLQRAFVTLLRNRVSRGGILAPGAGLVKQGEANKGIASRWYPETLVRRIEAIHEQRARIDCREADGLQVLAEECTNRDAAFFIDPPYPVAGRRLYRFHTLDHRRLFELMDTLTGPFLTTYDYNPEIRALAEEFGFAWKTIPMKSTHHEKKLELLISRDLAWLASAEEQSCAAALAVSA